MSIQENGEANLISFTSDNDFFRGKTETFTVMGSLLELTQHIPPRGSQYIRRYGLYASRTKGKWPDLPHVVRLAPAGWKERRLQVSDPPRPDASKYLSFAMQALRSPLIDRLTGGMSP